jgi:TPP-dependent 2-oxoacid decarboxylase
LIGVPTAYHSPLFDAAIRQGMRTLVTASDLEAGYAADGYARTKGLGAASVAYGVGALSMINAIAGDFVERSPVVVVNGGPTPRALSNLHQFDIVPSHSIGQDATDLSAYKLVTASAARAGPVPPLVDAAIASAIRTKHPSYIEINMGNAVEHTDFLVTLGAVFANGYASVVQNAFGRMVEIYHGKVRIKTGAKQNAEISTPVPALVTEAAKAPPKPVPPGATPAAPGPGSVPLTYRQVFERIAAVLDDTLLVIPRYLPRRLFGHRPAGERARRFSLQLRAGLDRAFGRRRGRCVLRLRAPAACGDGGFHMTATALSTVVQFHRVVILAIGIYGFELQ